MDEKENTGTESSAVTAIKVKVVIDTNKKELDQQFNSVKEHYKEKPVKIAFGVNQNDTIRNINDALDKVVKSGKLKTPKVTLDVKIDQSKVTAQLKKAMQSAAKQTVKVDTGKSGSTKTQDTSKSDISRLFSLANRQAKLKADEASLIANGNKSSELKAVQTRLSAINDEMDKLKTKTKDVITESQKLKLEDIEKTGKFNADRNTAKGADSVAKELKKQNQEIADDLKKTLTSQESEYEKYQKKIQSLENYSKNNSNYKNDNIKKYLYGEDGTGKTSGKLKELRNQLASIENTTPGKAIQEFDKKCKTLDTTIDSTSQHLKELGFDFRDINQANVDMTKFNTFKSTYQIMKELSDVWKDLSDTTQANITELISGKRGGQSTSALLNNFSVAEDAMKQALNSSGSAMRENQTYMDSLQAKLNQLDSAFQKFSTDLMKSDIPKFFISLATVFVDGADSAVKFAGALPTLTAAISGVLSVMQMSGKLKNGAGKVNMPSYICCV